MCVLNKRKTDGSNRIRIELELAVQNKDVFIAVS